NSYSGSKASITDNIMTNGTGTAQSAVVLIRDDAGSYITVTGNDGTTSTQ
ncbi:MAG: hypothetical protein GQ558_09870, partial [Thermoplasmata archaeon]|nr:hypothetical protein [Thermoplasmata archaeon]